MPEYERRGNVIVHTLLLGRRPEIDFTVFAGLGVTLFAVGLRPPDNPAKMTCNPRIIVLNGFRRGGTNIVWNILESHPQVCSPMRETGQILYSEGLPWLPDLPAKLVLRAVLTQPFISRSPIGRHFDRLIQRALFAHKMENLTEADNRFKFDGVPYSAEEVENSVLCVKSVNLDASLTPYFARYYPHSTFIGLMRNGYAICNGMMRRGETAKRAGQVYRRIGRRMIEDHRAFSRHMLLRFEDVLKDPFAVATELFTFAGLDPTRLEKLRLKSKKVLTGDGQHAPRFGEEDRKYWFDRSQIWQILDPGIDETQVQLLTRDDRRTFEKYAAPVLEYFGYA